MKTQEEISEEIQRLLNDDRLEEAEILIEQLVPISAEEFRKRLDAAPYDDEPVTPEQRRRLDEFHAELAIMRAQRGTERRAG